MCEFAPVKVKILLVIKDEFILSLIVNQLTKEGYDVHFSHTIKQAEEKLKANKYSLALLDAKVTESTENSLYMKIKLLYNIPVIFISSSYDEHSVVKGLDMGADDYIYIPARSREVMARIKNVLRRNGKTQPALECENIKVDTVRGLVTKDGKEVFLSALEYRILLVFLCNKGVVMSRQQLLEAVWDMDGEYVNDNTLTVYIKRIREKIEDDPTSPKIIRTVRGLGYKVG